MGLDLLKGSQYKHLSFQEQPSAHFGACMLQAGCSRLSKIWTYTTGCHRNRITCSNVCIIIWPASSTSPIKDQNIVFTQSATMAVNFHNRTLLIICMPKMHSPVCQSCTQADWKGVKCRPLNSALVKPTGHSDSARPGAACTMLSARLRSCHLVVQISDAQAQSVAWFPRHSETMSH